ncbi:MAG TPA: hypothetical protein VFA02_12150 [Pseudacidobacterium sp.]|nr:hypothetical protein [Pseudacidobacterium sp.]
MRIIRPVEWPDGITLRHREYLDGLIEDWSQTPPSQLSLLLDQLSELSTGPLRSAGHGQCASGQIDAVTAEFFASAKSHPESVLQQDQP